MLDIKNALSLVVFLTFLNFVILGVFLFTVKTELDRRPTVAQVDTQLKLVEKEFKRVDENTQYLQTLISDKKSQKNEKVTP